MNQKEWKQLRQQFESLQTGWPTFGVILVDVGALALSLWMRGRGAVWTIASIAVLALVLIHSYLWVHEASHSAICENKAVNDLVGHVAGWLIVMPYLSRRRSHLLHHVWAGHPTGDPANRRLIQRFSVMSEKEADVLERIWRSWIPLLTLNDRLGLWRDAFQERQRGNRIAGIRHEIRANYRYLVGYVCLLGALLAAGELTSFASWFFPALLLQFFLEELVNAPHHAQTPLLHADDKALPYWEQHRVTHSCKRVTLWSPAVLLNFNLHTAHHLFPRVPWSGLPAVHRELVRRLPELEEQQTTTHELAWSFRNRRVPILKLMGHYFDRIPQQR